MMQRSTRQSSRWVLITGASSGIGESCALMLAGRDWKVLAGVRNEADADRLRDAEQGIVPLLLDVTKQDQIARAVEVAERHLGSDGLSGLVNNAGIATGGPLEYLPIDRFRQSLEVNVVGALAVTQAFLPLLRARSGRIVNISSISGRIALPFIAPYAASKHALEAMSDCLRVELSPWDIHVSLIEPGNVRTPIWEKSLAAARALRRSMPKQAERDYGSALNALEAEIGKKQPLSADDVARAVTRALESQRPRARYPLGAAVHVGTWLDRLPARWRDGVIRRALPKWGQLAWSDPHRLDN